MSDSTDFAIPSGFRVGAATAGIKRSGKPDIALFVADRPSPAAAIFTRNACAAACVERGRRLAARGRLLGVVVNSGNANAATGDQGRADCDAMAALAAAPSSANPDDFLVCSTGVIGVPLPMEKVRAGIVAAAGDLGADESHWRAAVRAIMTTDTRPKLVTARIPGGFSLLGMAKGAGMIHPNMATMLGFLFTDAPLGAAQLDRALRAAADASFNAISIDGDTSTNDTLSLISSGLDAEATAPSQPGLEAAFGGALTALCLDLAKMILLDQEGGCAVLCRIEVAGAADRDTARRLARAVAVSPLFKCALHGADPNWGRIVAALGNAGVPLRLESIGVSLDEIELLRAGRPLPFVAAEASAVLKRGEAAVRISVGAGPGSYTYYTADLSEEYVSFNADYTT